MSLDVSHVAMRHYWLNYIFHVPTPLVWILVVAGPITASPLLVRICLFFCFVSLRSICIERNDNIFRVFWEADLEVLSRYFFEIYVNTVKGCLLSLNVISHA
jgi:hypothetical protein